VTLDKVTVASIDDRTLRWVVEHLRVWSWFPEFFGDPAKGQVSNIERVIALNPADFATTERIQVGGLLTNNPTVVGETQRELIEIYFGYVFEATTHVVDDDAITFHTVLREIVKFLRGNPTLGGHTQCLIEARILGLGRHQDPQSRRFRNLAIVQATYQLKLNPNTQEPILPG